ncbi:hypothetical protein BV401_28405 [Streptomyces malaysiensis subsp. malaysiensis]|uniref:Core-binding (CB) domain-containing protein n=1 Tax=Streptomyces autolyticus TaxID=75293 RepID=A0ABM6HIH0_9ACTN|nr:hypothetical protein BV401_28405 [Streptomyces autolyticus]
MATVYQRCKSDKRSVYYLCEKLRCGHAWTVRYREPGGAGARERLQSFEKKSQADAFAAKLRHDKYDGIYLDPKRGEITLRAYSTEWLQRQIISDSTYRNYESFLRIHLIPRLGDKTIAGVQRKDIEAFIAALLQRLAASTVCDRMKMVASLFQTAIKEKRRADDPTEGVKLPRSATHAVDEDEIPTLHEFDLIAKQISPQYRLTVYLQAGRDCASARPWPSPPTAVGPTSSACADKSAPKRTAKTARPASSRSSTGLRGSTGTSPCPTSSPRRLTRTCATGAR